MSKFANTFSYYAAIGFDKKRTLILLIMSILLPLFAFGICGVYDYPADQLDLYNESVKYALTYYLYSVFPIALIVVNNLLLGYNLSTSYKTSLDYSCLVGNVSRSTVILAKLFVNLSAVVTFELIYFISAQLLSLLFSICLFNKPLIIDTFKIFFNSIVAAGLTTVVSVIIKSAFSGLVAPLLIVMSIFTKNTNASNKPLQQLGSLLNFFVPVYHFEFPIASMNEESCAASIALGMFYGLLFIGTTISVSVVIYNHQDL